MTTSTSTVSNPPGQGPAWHTLSIEDALREQGVEAATGLSQAEAASRLKKFGPNKFATIIRAVENGRALYDNLLKYIRFQMGSLFAFIVTFLASALFGILGGVPFLPLQVLWINFTIDIFLSIGLGMGNPTPGLMERAPRKAGEQILPARLFMRLIIAGVIIAACSLGVMQYAVAGAHLSVEIAHTMGMTTFSLASIFFALETNDELRSVFSHVTLESHRLIQMCGWSLLATFIVTAPDFMNRIFGTSSLNFQQWFICIVVSSLILWATEIVKIFRRRADTSSVAGPETVATAKSAA